MKPILHLSTISELANLGGTTLQHPLVSVVDFSKVKFEFDSGTKLTAGFYQIFFKNYCSNNISYGREKLDFQDGSLFCLSPNQILTFQNEVENDMETKKDKSGWGLFFHPDIIRKTSLGEKIKEYSFFSYEMSEALHLSEKEKLVLSECVQNIQKELSQNTDIHSQNIIVSNIELFLNYCLRYYGRQFIIRKPINNHVLIQLENYLRLYFKSNKHNDRGLPTVKYLASQVNLSPNYLSDLLKNEVGMNAQSFIHSYIIEEAKSILLNSNYRISEIAHNLGFEYPQYFSKLFKQKTGLSPFEYRNLN